MQPRISLPEKAQMILLRLLDLNRESTKSSLLQIVPNSYSLDRNLRILEAQGLIVIREEVVIRRTYSISLTERGKAVATQLRKTEQTMNGTLLSLDSFSAKMEDEFESALEKIAPVLKVRAYDDHVLVEDSSVNESITLHVRRDGNGVPRLWCERHQGYHCVHIDYAWTLPQVQEMYYRYSAVGPRQ